jgi:hypothetical protein
MSIIRLIFIMAAAANAVAFVIPPPFWQATTPRQVTMNMMQMFLFVFAALFAITWKDKEKK